DTTAEVEVRVRNYGSTPRTALPLTLTAGGREIARTTVNLAPASASSVKVPATFSTAGSQVLRARVATSGLRTDDELDAATDVLDPVRVLIISGDAAPARNEFTAAADYLRLALAPYATVEQRGPDPAAVR